MAREDLNMEEVDWIEWVFFLEMLSVRRIEPFIDELHLPFEQECFPKVMRLARACLEVHMFSSICVPEGCSESPNLFRAWQNYRVTEGILSEKVLQEFFEHYGGEENIAQKVYVDLQEWIGKELAIDLKRWFTKNYRSSPDPIWRWPWVLELLLTNKSLSSFIPINTDQQEHVYGFYKHCKIRKIELEVRFQTIYQAAKQEGATVWEQVLQTFPADGLGNNYPWISSIEQCLWLRLIRQEWGKLKRELGFNTLTKFTDWVQEQVKILPFSIQLPDLAKLDLD